MIDGETKMVGLIGWPVKHSLSPVIHNSAFEALGLNWRYVPLPVNPGLINHALPGLAALGFQGVNVTAPYKQHALVCSTRLSPEAFRIGAVNTITFGRKNDTEVEINGSNTDMQGFLNALYGADFHPQKNQLAIVVGAGGAARAVICGLLEAGVGEIAVFSRSLEKGQTLVRDLSVDENQAKIHMYPFDVYVLCKCALDADLLVNTTPVGTWPKSDVSVWPEDIPIPSHITVYDLVYNPVQTRLLIQAQKAQVRCISGLEMLIQQAALAFELWTGEQAPIDVMRTHGKAVLAR